MGQAMNKLKKGGEEKEQNSTEPKELAGILEEEYNNFKDLNFDDFYHQFYVIIQKLNEKGGAMQFKLPKKEDLQAKFDKHCRGKDLTKDLFKKIMGEVIQLDSFYIGQGAIDVLTFLFGIPIVTYFARQLIPQAKFIREDVLLSAATSGTVILLAKTHKL